MPGALSETYILCDAKNKLSGLLSEPEVERSRVKKNVYTHEHLRAASKKISFQLKGCMPEMITSFCSCCLSLVESRS